LLTWYSGLGGIRIFWGKKAFIIREGPFKEGWDFNLPLKLGILFPNFLGNSKQGVGFSKIKRTKMGWLQFGKFLEIFKPGIWSLIERWA